MWRRTSRTWRSTPRGCPTPATACDAGRPGFRPCPQAPRAGSLRWIRAGSGYPAPAHPAPAPPTRRSRHHAHPARPRAELREPDRQLPATPPADPPRRSPAPHRRAPRLRTTPTQQLRLPSYSLHQRIDGGLRTPITQLPDDTQDGRPGVAHLPIPASLAGTAINPRTDCIAGIDLMASPCHPRPRLAPPTPAAKRHPGPEPAERGRDPAPRRHPAEAGTQQHPTIPARPRSW